MSFIPKAESFFTLVEEGVLESKCLGDHARPGSSVTRLAGQLGKHAAAVRWKHFCSGTGAPEGGRAPRDQLVCDAHKDPELEKDNGRLKSKILKTLV